MWCLNDKFLNLRRAFPVFRYDGFGIIPDGGGITLRFDFSVPGLCEFHPTTRVVTDNLTILNSPDSACARRLVFLLGLAEAVSYWKAACPERFVIACGDLGADEREWWKRLWFGGLGEFFYRNSIDTDFDSFVNIECEGAPLPDEREEYVSSGLELVPVGGGKDSAVTLSLLSDLRRKIMCFTVNDQPAREHTVLAAGLERRGILRTLRTIDPELLRLNSEGFLNGHTPFSSVVAFLSLYCARLVGADDIILSNESSANESTVGGADVNHQYSKSFDFERGFSSYVASLGIPVRYFSLLRPFCELQIAKKFASLPQFFGIFRSCNAGSKKNIWCGACAKCLFVYIILSPFLGEEELAGIFGRNLLDDAGLAADLDALCGAAENKPFECIGTVGEVCAALSMTREKYLSRGRPLPVLLERFKGSADPAPLLSGFDDRNLIPPEFLPRVKEMHKYVSSAAY